MKPPVWCKNLLHNCYSRPIIADLVLKFSNFCYHGNKGRSKVDINDTIKLANFKKPGLMQVSGTYVLYRPSDSLLCFKIPTFRYHGNKHRSRVKLCNLENPLFNATILVTSLTLAELCTILLKLPFFRCRGNKGRSGVNFNDTIKLHNLENPLFGARFSAISVT